MAEELRVRCCISLSEVFGLSMFDFFRRGVGWGRPLPLDCRFWSSEIIDKEGEYVQEAGIRKALD